MVAVEIAAGHEDKLMCEKALCLEEGMRLVQCLGKWNPSIHLLLSDSSQLGAERRELWVKFGLDVGLEFGNDRFLLNVNDDNGELDDFMAVDRISLVVGASALEVIDANELDWSLVEELLFLIVEYPSKVGDGDAAICKTLRQHDFILRDPEGDRWVSVHSLDHIDFDDDLARAAHARDHAVPGQTDSQVYVVPPHLV